MKRTTISMEDDLFIWCEKRATALGLSTSQFFRILAHNDRATKSDGLSIVAEQQTSYVAQNGNVTINHAPPNCAAKKKKGGKQ